MCLGINLHAYEPRPARAIPELAITELSVVGRLLRDFNDFNGGELSARPSIQRRGERERNNARWGGRVLY